MAELALGVYVHWPWCRRKCPYCDFNSHPAAAMDEARWLDAVLRDLAWERARGERRPVASVFLGGGTPSLAAPATIGALLGALDRTLGLAGDCEVTLEANPGAAERGRFGDYRAAGVTRLSIGVQSLRDGTLAAIGRIHDARAARAAVTAAQAAGFADINVDLMYGLPGDDVDGALGDLTQALALGVSHLSWYQLTIEPGTAFGRRPPPLPGEETVAAIEAAGREALAAAGFERYEISAWCRGERRCRHNVNYWQYGDYLGLGPGAHGKRTLADGEVERTRKLAAPARYMAHAGGERAVRSHRLGPRERGVEFLMNALRMTDGFRVATWCRRTGLAAGVLDEALAPVVAAGLVERSGDRVRASARGLDYLDSVLAAIELAAPEPRRVVPA